MADETRTPVAIRIVRPYDNEEDFLSKEPDTLTRTTATLLGAQPKPQGVILRFEMTLASGEPLLRGEGRVVGFKAATATADSALTLRFTRLDARSKALVDRAAVVRESKTRLPSIPPPLPAEAPAGGAPPAPPTAPASAPSSDPAATDAPRPGRKVPPAAPSSDPANPDVARPGRKGPPPLPAKAHTKRPPALQVAKSSERGSPLTAPANREPTLDRLRERARALKPEAIAAILAKRPSP